MLPRPARAAVVAFALACSSRPQPGVERRAPAKVQAAVDCGRAVTGLDSLIVGPGVITIGETHGTAEIPRFVGDLACQIARGGVPVRVGLEFPGRHQPAFDAFLGSAGTPADVAALRGYEVWQVRPPFADGRSSVAMFGLVQRVRAWKAAGLPVDLFLYDQSVAQRDDGPRDRNMAVNIASEFDRHPDSILVMLGGDGHTLEFPEHPGPSAAWYLAEAGAAPVTALKWNCKGGRSWGPFRELQEAVFPHVQADWSVELRADVKRADGWFSVGAVSPSPPLALVPETGFEEVRHATGP
jgi:hypothetical protein